ncbi:unnamed protein product [Ambrosiozyma monospora]|uniref:Unnamed protein product n=1 Tax=Ambrosiozyma monospora TaxID=43982 RepID=A0ACB5SZ68_AMBMO|nr:unnamed protein product [Ambrosiozyma monospora]
MLGETLKRTNYADFELFQWFLKSFRKKPKLTVDVSGRPLCFFGLTPEMTLPIGLSLNYVQKRIFSVCDFEMLIFSTISTFSTIKSHLKFVNTLINMKPKKSCNSLDGHHWRANIIDGLSSNYSKAREDDIY